MATSTKVELAPQALPTRSKQEDLSTVTDDRLRPVPEVQAFEFGKASNDEIIAAVIRSGCAIIRNAIGKDDLDTIEKETRPYLGDPNESYKASLGDWFSDRNKRVTGLPGKSKTYMEKVAQHPTFKAVRDDLLTSRFPYWNGADRREAVDPPRLDNTNIFAIRPGAPIQDLHRDDTVWHNHCYRKTAEQYERGQDCLLGFFVAGKPATKENGATRIIPGSHLWDENTPPSEELTVQPELNRGDGFLFLGSCFHGASPNKTSDEERLIYSAFFVKGTLKQVENQYLAQSFEKLVEMGYDDAMLEDIGYYLGSPYNGYVDYLPPLEYMKQTLAAK